MNNDLALIMAAKRALETERPDRLFDDPFAARLAGEELLAMKARYQRQFGPNYATKVASAIRFVAIRTRFFDDFLLAANYRVRQIVILGAGMDARAFRLPWLPETHLYEIDRAEVMQPKNELLQTAKAKSHRHAIAIDLSQDWCRELLNQGYQPLQPTIWLMEGVLMYLNKTEVRQTIANISQFSTANSYLGADLINKTSLQLALSQGDRVRSRWHFGTDDPTLLFSAWGWHSSVVQPREIGTKFGRNALFSTGVVKSGRGAFLVTAYKSCDFSGSRIQ